jgi:hypothetical protein
LELPANSSDFLEGNEFPVGKLHRTTRISFEKCAPLSRRKFVSAHCLNYVNCNTKAAFQAPRAIELTERIPLIGRRSEAAGSLCQIDRDTETSLEAETKTVRTKRIALISTARNGTPLH